MTLPILQDVRYVGYEASHFMPLRALFKTVWGANRSEQYDVKHWNETLTGVCPGVVGLRDEQVVGFYMVWPMLFSDGQEQIFGGQPIDSMVHPDFQGKGMLRELAHRCYELASESKISVMFGSPNRTAYAGNVGGLNWCHVSNTLDLVRPLNPISFRQERWTENGDGWVCDSAVSQLSSCIAQRDCAPEISHLFEEIAPVKRSWQVSRTTRWMAYRYRSAPDAEYYTISLPKGRDSIAAAVCGFRQSGAGLKATLAEIVASDENGRKAVINAVASWARHKGARYLHAKSTNNDPIEGLFWRGFIPVRRIALISRTLTSRCFLANPYSPKAWTLFGGAFDIM